MKRIVFIVLLIFTGWVGILHAQAALTPDYVPRMSTEELSNR